MAEETITITVNKIDCCLTKDGEDMRNVVIIECAEELAIDVSSLRKESLRKYRLHVPTVINNLAVRQHMATLAGIARRGLRHTSQRDWDITIISIDSLQRDQYKDLVLAAKGEVAAAAQPE